MGVAVVDAARLAGQPVPLAAYDRIGYECNHCGQSFVGTGHDCEASPGALHRRVAVLESQVRSLQLSAPRGIPAAEPSCKEDE